MEHTFAYAGHEVVWENASPLSAADVRELDDFAAERHVELVPNQNSFGHMHRWLVHEPYRALAECPDGFEHPWNWASEPYGLCPTDPACLALLERLYDQLLPNFRSRRFNVGLDETIDLGRGRSQQACAERGAGRVYLEFLRGVHARVQQRGRSMQFWGDIIREHPELIPELPKDAVALEWGYEAEHPFAEHLARLSRAGLEFYVCPGTSSWNSIAGRTHNAVLNLAVAAREGKAAGATGMLVTDWGDNGHLQPLSVSYLGLLLGAGFSWNVAAAERPLELDVPGLLDAWAFGDAAAVMGRVAHDLGNTYREAGSLRANSSVLFWILIKPERQFAPAGVTRDTLERALEHAGRASEPLSRARPATAEGALAGSELGWASDLLQFACRLGLARCSLDNPGALGSLPPSVAAPLAGELDGLLERHRALWAERNRPGGLDDSARRLERIRDTLRH
jgi:hexosaminidase